LPARFSWFLSWINPFAAWYRSQANR